MRPYKREKITAVTMLTAFGLTVAAMTNPALASTIDTQGKTTDVYRQEHVRANDKQGDHSISKKAKLKKKAGKTIRKQEDTTDPARAT